ncbi:uncharacterized protein K460DRAFT_357731 [Cucurbitaria berberidis CBS 394.84]|uniref:Uncharacterized protein n=1 Tax=Cucurbitaria berberidis CBS 394.84 TaxID=1168544 RepID=A0A9P4L6R6_9PLEO|nr:uncharacterized protein K460DRAFT_357731 [Cucurbitaria berberidis CBS 394.84]KAF1844100.1 hypothetical protein K460DRAFT_357731 [Cucurbitaria berberidis CBS 394.84]
MFNPFRLLKGLWTTPTSETSPSLAATLEASSATQSPTAQEASRLTNATPVSTTFVNYPAIRKLKTQPATTSVFSKPTFSSHTIQSSPNPIFGTAALGGVAPHIQHPPSAHTDDIEMPDADPECLLKAPPEESDNSSPSTDSLDGSDTRRATSEDDNTDKVPDDTSTGTPAEGDNRPKLQPKRQQDRHHKQTAPKLKRDFAAEIVYEVGSEDNPLPKGYLGTFRGTRWFSPDYNACLECGQAGEHRLVCGHWIKSAAPCGLNCKTEKLDEAPFVCPTCRDIVQDILSNKLTGTEITKLNGLKVKDNSLLMGYCVEYVTKRVPELKANITETVFSLLRNDYGRICEASDGPVPAKVPSFEQTIRDMQEEQERKEREQLAKENPLNKHDKRRCVSDDDPNVQNATQAPGSTQVQDDTPEAAQNSSTSSNGNKKPKKKLETHREPISSQTCGSKRPSSSPDADTGSPVSANKTNKKLKEKLETVREPITPQTRGTKRHSLTSTYVAPPYFTKKIALNTPPTFGDASFMVPHPSVVGPLIRKRDSAVHIETGIETEVRKRRHSAIILNGKDAEPSFNIWKPRAGLEEPIWAGEEEL